MSATTKLSRAERTARANDRRKELASGIIRAVEDKFKENGNFNEGLTAGYEHYTRLLIKFPRERELLSTLYKETIARVRESVQAGKGILAACRA